MRKNKVFHPSGGRALFLKSTSFAAAG